SLDRGLLEFRKATFPGPIGSAGTRNSLVPRELHGPVAEERHLRPSPGAGAADRAKAPILAVLVKPVRGPHMGARHHGGFPCPGCALPASLVPASSRRSRCLSQALCSCRLRRPPRSPT